MSRAALVEKTARAHCLGQGYDWDRHPDFHHVWRREAVRMCDLALEEAAKAAFEACACNGAAAAIRALKGNA